MKQITCICIDLTDLPQEAVAQILSIFTPDFGVG